MPVTDAARGTDAEVNILESKITKLTLKGLIIDLSACTIRVLLSICSLSKLSLAVSHLVLPEILRSSCTSPSDPLSVFEEYERYWGNGHSNESE